MQEPTSFETEKMIYLLSQKLAGTITVEQESELDQWAGASPERQAFVDNTLEAGYAQSVMQGWSTAHTENRLKAVKSKLAPRLANAPALWPRIAVVAAAVATIIFGIWFFTSRHDDNGRHPELVSGSDIAPGKQGATLTLANGKKIVLSDAANGELAEQAGVSITKTADGKLIYEFKQENGTKPDVLAENTLSTAKGETYQLRLPDGSLVWLNAASSLTYSAALNERGVRRVRLVGEGYFEVAKNADRPFIVETERQKVEVLGTHFNVNAYSDELITKTTLIEGSVRVSEGLDAQLLIPGCQALNRGRGLEIIKIDTDLAVAWKNNKFIFEKLDIRSIMRMIERWYNVEVVFEGEVTTEKFWGSVSRYDNVSRVLSTLESTGNVHFRIEGRRIYVAK